MTRSPLDRRTLLRGAGAGVGLPLLEAMLPPLVTAPEPPVRLAWVYVPNGVRIHRWRGEPAGVPPPKDRPGAPAPPDPGGGEHAGAEPFPLRDPRPPTNPWRGVLAPLAPWRGRVSLLRGLTADKARANGDGPGDHARAAAAWLTGVQPLKSEGAVRLGVSADQHAAAVLGAATPLPSLVIGCEGARLAGQCDSGYSCAYSGHLSWLDAVTPATKETRPARVFDRLFRGGLSPAERAAEARQGARRRSVLDWVRADARRLARELGGEDRARLERHLEALGALERRIAQAAELVVEAAPDDARPVGVPADFREHATQLAELVALAFATDATRVVTFMIANEGSNRPYRELAVGEGHHSLSHHGRDPRKLAQIERIDRFLAGLFAGLVEGLATAPEGAGDVLQSSLVVYGSGIADGNRHDHHDLPILLAGEGRGAARPGRTLDYPRETPLADLHLALLEAAGVAPAGLGDGRGPLGGL